MQPLALEERLPARIRAYFALRAFSGLLDEAWIVAIPLFCTERGIPLAKLGYLSSAIAAGDVLGFICLPALISAFPVVKLAILSDFLSGALMLAFAALLAAHALGIELLIAGGFVTAFLFAIWFASTDTTIAALTEGASAQKLQRAVVTSNTLGTVAGPAAGGLLFGAIGLLGIALVNGASFWLQLTGFRGLSRLADPRGLRRRPFWETVRSGARAIARSPSMPTLISVSILLKLFFLSVPFLIYLLASQGASKTALGVVFSLIGAGILAGAQLYHPADDSKLARAYRLNGLVMAALFCVLLLACQLTHNLIALGAICFVTGIAVGRYQILFRSIRQVTERVEDMPVIIVAAGLLARSGTPFAGFLYPALLSGSPLLRTALWGALGLVLVAASTTIMIGKYERFLTATPAESSDAR